MFRGEESCLSQYNDVCDAKRYGCCARTYWSPIANIDMIGIIMYIN